MLDSELPAATIKKLSTLEGRQVFADALGEQDDPRGEFISVQLRLLTAPASEKKKLLARERTLLAKHSAAWSKGFNEHFAVPTLRRGFIEHLWVNAYFLEGAKLEKAFKLAPLVESLELTGKKGGLVGSFDAGELRVMLRQGVARATKALGSLGARLRSATFRDVQLVDGELESLLATLPNVKSFSVLNNSLGLASAKRLASRGFAELNVASNRIGPSGAEVLFNAESLEVLDVTDNGVTAASLEKAGPMKKLRSLELGRNSLGGAGIQALTSMVLPSLTSLGLRQTELREQDVVRLVKWPRFSALEHLDVGKNQLKAATVAKLAKAGGAALKILAKK